MHALSGLDATSLVANLWITAPATVAGALIPLLFGAVVGFSLGLTGGGGSIFAVPLLVYGLRLPPREAMGVSLAAVGATALWGVAQRLRRGEVEIKTGVLFSLAGMLGAPLGTWLRGQIPTPVLLGLFAAVMVLVAARMWVKAAQIGVENRALADGVPDGEAGPACRRDPEGILRLTSRCMMVLALVGLATGVLSGLFGVGGGFVIVPALVFFSQMGIHRAVATSLLVISMIGVAGVASHLLAGMPLPLAITGLFLVGGIGGMWGGTRVGRRLSGTLLQRIFAVAILAVALYMVATSVLHP